MSNSFIGECMSLVIIYRKCFRSYRAPLVTLHDRHPLCVCSQPSKRHLHESRDFTTVVCRCRRYWIDLHLYLNSSSHWKLRMEMKSEWFRMRHAIFHEQKRTAHSRVTAPRRTYWVMVQYIAMGCFGITNMSEKRMEVYCFVSQSNGKS